MYPGCVNVEIQKQITPIVRDANEKQIKVLENLISDFTTFISPKPL
jgi:hypothetical protein